MNAVSTLPRQGQSVAPTIAALIRDRWSQSRGEELGISYRDFEELLLDIAVAHHWGVDKEHATVDEQIQFLSLLNTNELVLARACARGNEKAWEIFLTEYRELLYAAAYAITKQESLGRELADSLYAELYGTATREGLRQSKLASYSGRGSLSGWLRSVLSQRFIDHYRQARHTVSLEERETELLAAALPASNTVGAIDGPPLRKIGESLGRVLRGMKTEESFLLQSYYLDQRNMAEIAKLLGVHESTVSRKLNQLTKDLRKKLLKQLQQDGLSRRAAEEALSTDVRDLDIDVRKFLQAVGTTSFSSVGTKLGAAVGDKQ